MSDPLRQNVLVLNKNYQPVDLYTVEEALVSVCKGKSEILDTNYQGYDILEWATLSSEDEQASIRTVTYQFLIPEVVRLVEFDEIIERDITYTRYNIFYRDNYMCQYCGIKCARSELTIDHVIPKSRRKEFGMSSEQIAAWTNVVCACQVCNVTKDNRTPEEANMPLLNKPIAPTWVGRVRGIHPSLIRPSWKPFLKDE